MASASAVFAEITSHTLSPAVPSARKITALRSFSLDATGDIAAFVAEHRITGVTRASVLGSRNFFHPPTDEETASVRQPAAGETALVLLPGENDARLAWVTSEGTQALAVIPAGYAQIFEAVQLGLGLKFKAAAGRLCCNENYDFSETAAKPAPATKPAPSPAAAPQPKPATTAPAKSKTGPIIIATTVVVVAAIVGLAAYFKHPGSRAPAPVIVPADKFAADPRKVGNDRYRFEVSGKGFIQAVSTKGDEVLVESAAGISLQGSYVGADGRRKWFNVGGVDDAGYVAIVNKSVQAGVTVFDVKVTHPRFELTQTFSCLPGSIKVAVNFNP